jgi:uncharacterized protein (TIGR02271 family)
MIERDDNRGGMQSERDRERRGDANRDPITKTPGAHPAGTGIGAAAGGAAGVAGGAAAGAASGTVGGPAGAAIGGVIGAVAGGLAGKGVAEKSNPTRTGESAIPGGLENYIGYDVVDRDEEKIGTLDCLWSDHTGQATFLGVRTGWIFGRTHVVPAHGAHVSRNSNRIRLPYSVQKVKEAPAYDADEEISGEREREVYTYYGITGQSTQATQPRRETSRQTGRDTGRESATVDLVEEQLKVGKREVEAGGVRLRKIVRTETVNQPVELRREEIVVERVPGAGTPARQAFEGEDIYIPLRREEAVVQKEATVREQVRVRKTAQTEQQNVSGQVRREDVEVEGTGEARNRVQGEESTAANRIRERQETPRSKRQ